MTIGLVSHGKCSNCGDELRDCICADPCAVCGSREDDLEECAGCGRQLCEDCHDDHEHDGCGCTVCGWDIALECDAPAECPKCGTGPWCAKHLTHPHLTPEDWATQLLAAYDKALAEIVALDAEAEASYADGCLNAYDDVQEAQGYIDEMLPDFVDVLRSLLKGDAR